MESQSRRDAIADAETANLAFRKYADGCPYRCGDETIPRRPGNALNIEVGRRSFRCIQRIPRQWPSGMALRWLGSGGGPEVFGHCQLNGCPLHPEFCTDCGHRRDAGHALGGPCITQSTGPGGSWPCGCESFRAVPALRDEEE